MSTRARAARSGEPRRAGRADAQQGRADHDPVLALQAMAGNRGVTALLGGGRPLPPPARDRIGALLGHDISGVRLHPDTPLPPDMLACAAGEHVALGPGVRALEPVRSTAVLVHELAHVVQQRRGGPGTTTPSPALEADAHRAAAAVVRGSPATVTQASGPAPAALTVDEARRKLWGLLPAPVQERVRPLAVQAAAAMDTVVPPTSQLPGPAAAVVDRTVATASAAAPLAKRAASAVGPAVRPAPGGKPAGVTATAKGPVQGMAREPVMGYLGAAKGVWLEVGNVADVLIGLPSTFQWAAGAGIGKAESAGYLSKERADQARALVAQSAADYNTVTKWAAQKGILETDPDTGAPSVSPVIGRQFDRLAGAVDKAAFADAAPESSIVFTSYEVGELTGAVGSQVALGFVGVEEVQLALKVVGLLGAVKGLVDEMHKDRNWRTSPTFWLRVLGVVMSLVGLRNAKASGKIINLVIAAGGLTLAAAPMATLHEHWTDPALAADPAQREATLKRDFVAVAKAIGPLIVDIVRQAVARGGAGPTRRTGGTPAGRPHVEATPPAAEQPGAVAPPREAAALPKGRGDVEPPSGPARSAKPVARTGTDDVGLVPEAVPALHAIEGGRAAAPAGPTATARPPGVTPPVPVPPVRATAGPRGTGGRRGSGRGATPAGVASGSGGRAGATPPPAPGRRRGGGPRRRQGGATAEGVGADFTHSRFGAVRTPPTEFVGRPGAPVRPLATHSNAPPTYRVERVSLDRRSPHHWDRPGAGTVPQPGTVLEFPNGARVWREQPGGPIIHEAPLAAGIGRAGAERGHYTATEHGGLAPGPRQQRAHTLGQGTGFESPYGIYYAPEYVNQTLQNHGIESFMRDLAARRRSGETFRVVTTTAAQPRTRRLGSIDYKIEAIVDGKVHEVATYGITVGGTQAQPLVQARPIRFADNAVARDIQASVPRPQVISQPVRHVADGTTPAPAVGAPRRRIVGQQGPAAAEAQATQPTPAPSTAAPAAAAQPTPVPPAPAQPTAPQPAAVQPAAVQPSAQAPASHEDAPQSEPSVHIRVGVKPEEHPPVPQPQPETLDEIRDQQAAQELAEKEARQVQRLPWPPT